MKYMGSKSKLAKEFLPIVLADRQEGRFYVEPFSGGMNTIDKVEGNRIANDLNPYLIDMWQNIVYNNWKPEKITKELYHEVRTNKEKFPPYLVGWVGFCCSYKGKWFGGYSGEVLTKIGTTRDYQSEAIHNMEKTES